MTDIIERLRKPRFTSAIRETMAEAADEIERLKERVTEAENRQGLAEIEIERLREALDTMSYATWDSMTFRAYARAALAQKEGE